MATIISVAALTACTSGSETQPTVVPSTQVTAPTISPGGTSVGSVLDDINLAWDSVESMRTTFWTTTGEENIATPTAAGDVTIEVAIGPDQRHITRLVDGVVVEEQISVEGRVFMKGPIVVAAIAPMVGTDTWVEVDPRGAGTTSAVAAQIAWLLTPVQSPFQAVSEETRALEAFPGDPLTIDGRSCQTWHFGTVNGIQQELAIDEQGLPCRLIQRAGELANVTLYEVNVPGISIVTPPVGTPTAP